MDFCWRAMINHSIMLFDKGVSMGIVLRVTDEEDDLPCGQHTMCSTNNMWTSDGSTQPNRKSESTNFNQFFSGI